MTRWTFALGCAALTLASCGSPRAAEGNGDQTVTDAALDFCPNLKSASSGGDTLMQSAFASSADGIANGGAELIEALVKQNGYRFRSAEVLNKTCWAYAEATGVQEGKAYHLRWRCPVKAYSVDPTDPDTAVLEMVESQSCDFNVDPGDPLRRDVKIDALKM